MSRRPQHKTRKQLRLETVSVQAELDQLKTPEGLADYLHSKRDNEEFQDAVSARVFQLRDLERQQAEEEALKPIESDDPFNSETGKVVSTETGSQDVVTP